MCLRWGRGSARTCLGMGHCAVATFDEELQPRAAPAAETAPGHRLGCGAGRLRATTTMRAALSCGTIRLKLLKLGALVRISVRRIKVAVTSTCPWQDEFALAHLRLGMAAG